MLQELMDEDGGEGAGPSEPRVVTAPMQPILLPAVFDSTEDYEAAWERGELEAIAPEALFPSLAPMGLPVDTTSQEIFRSLKSCYQSDRNRRILKPATAETLSIEAAYVRLALIYEKKSAARSDAHDHRIIFGEAGVGKSIFSQYLAYHWSREENPLWGGPQDRFQAVFWIRFKELLGESRSQPFESLLCKYCMPTLADQVAVELRTWLASHADRALFILDGYDEVADAVLGQDLALRDFIKEVLRRPFVLITSRPYRYSKIGDQPIESFAHYRNIGFRSEDFPRYLEAYFAEHPQKARLIRNIVAWLDQHLIAKSIAHVPLQLGMIAWLWQDAAQHQGRPLPDMLTLSTLYQEIAQRRLETIASAIPKKVEQCLSELAYGGMNAKNKADRYHFSTQQIHEVLTRLSHEHHIPFTTLEQCFFQEVLRLSLLRSEKGSINFQQADHYYFCHLTYQEYYCARYILGLFARIEQDKSYEHQIVELVAQKKFEQRYARVWWFVAGLLGGAWKKANEARTGIQAPSPALIAAEAITRHQLAIFFNEFQRGLRDIIGGYELGLLVRCVEEAQIEPRRFASDFPELFLRLQAGVKVLGRAVGILSGINRAELQANPFLNQLRLSPHVRMVIMDQDFVQNLPENRRGVWQELIELDNSIAKLAPFIMAEMSVSQRETVVDQLLMDLNHSSETVRKKAATTLGQVATIIPESQREVVINQLLNALRDSSEWVRWRAVIVFSQLAAIIPEQQREAVVNQLLITLSDSSEWVRWGAVTILGQLATIIPQRQYKAVINQLHTLAEDSNERVCQEAEISYGALLTAAFSLISLPRVLISDLHRVTDTGRLLPPKLLLLFHMNPEVRMCVLLMLSLFSVRCSDWRSWQSQRLLALSSNYRDPIDDQSATAFNQATLEEITEFLKLILLFCTEPELRERLCLLVSYLCFAHQLAITVEENQGSSHLKVYRQESSEIIPLAPQEIDSILDNLRQVYVEEVDPLHRSQVFPEVPTLIRDQRLWGLFRMPPAESVPHENLFQSLMAHPDRALEVTLDQWVVGVGAYKFEGWFNSHAFLVIEGMDEYGRGLFLRYDLARDRDSPVEKYHVISQKILSLQNETERSQALLKDILKGKKKTFCMLSPSQRNRSGNFSSINGSRCRQRHDGSLPFLRRSFYVFTNFGSIRSSKTTKNQLPHLGITTSQNRFKR